MQRCPTNPKPGKRNLLIPPLAETIIFCNEDAGHHQAASADLRPNRRLNRAASIAHT